MAQAHLLRGARTVSLASAFWTFLLSVSAIALGLSDDSLALIAFGAVGLFDFAADVVLVSHFRALHRDQRAEHLERIALRIITVGLIAVGLAAAMVSTIHLAEGQDTAHGSVTSALLAAVSLVGLSALAARKRHLAIRLPSPALRADGQLSGIGATLAAVTLAGTGANAVFGWWWTDPAAAGLIGLGAIGLGVGVAKST
jgi:divalent metal cation (Fe/Co/Zn/Cd) transporter